MGDFLRQVLETKHSEVAGLPHDAPARSASPAPHRDFAAALTRPGLSVIAEFKRRSPSVGPLADAATGVATRVRSYEACGAAALSVLTDRRYFGGSLDDLAAAREAAGLPVLCKDFLIDRRQLDAAVAAGCDAVLLIVRILDDATLATLLEHARDAGVEALVETHDAEEIARAVDAGAQIVGVNNRDLDTLEVDLGRCLRLRGRVPTGCVAVAESGVRRREDLIAVAEAGYDAALVGSSLMTGDPSTLLEAAREVTR